MDMEPLHSLPEAPKVPELSQKSYSGQWFKGGSQKIMAQSPSLAHQLFLYNLQGFYIF